MDLWSIKRKRSFVFYAHLMMFMWFLGGFFIFVLVNFKDNLLLHLSSVSLPALLFLMALGYSEKHSRVVYASKRKLLLSNL